MPTPQLSAAAAAAAVRAALAAAVPLSHPLPNAELSLATDASDSHIGGVLQQKEAAGWRPLGFFSRKLTETEVKYSAFDRELLACFYSIRHFRIMLEGRHFQLWTDHKPLLAALHRVSLPWTPRQQRQLAFIAECTSDVRHVPGLANVVADHLSRPPAAPVCQVAAHHLPAAPTCQVAAQQLDTVPDPPVVVDYAAMAAAQRSCPGVAALRAASGLSIVTRDVEGHPLLGDISTGVFRPVVPNSFQQLVFEKLHSISHPGIRATKRIILSRFVWRGAAANITAWTRACLTCQRGKITKHVHLKPLHIPVPGRRFSHIHVDLVGPLPNSGGCTYLFTIIDCTTRWAEAVPLAATSAADCARALFRGWVARFGVPAAITSDRGAQFTSALWAALCRLLGTQHVQTTAYHPEGNGLVERFHRRLKDALRARCAGPDWMDHLPWVMLGIRATPREDSAITPAQAVFGSALVLPGQLVSDPETSLDDFLMQIKSTLSRSENLSTRHNTAADRIHPTELPADLLDATHVLVRRDGHVPPLAPLYDGPYTVLRRATQFFTIQLGSREEVVSTSRLKPCHTPDVAPALPRQRGRPPRSAGQLGLPPRCPADHPCTPPAQPRAGEGVEPHGWPPLLPPRGGGSGGRPGAAAAPSLPTVEAPAAPSLPTVEAPAAPSLPTVEALPSILVQPGRPRRPTGTVRFQDQREEPATPAPRSQSGTVFPSTPAGVFARPDWSSTKRPARQRRRPSHLDLYTEVWGEPCGDEQSASGVQQQHHVAPPSQSRRHSTLHPLSASY